jgi:hypothetical protein
VSGVFWRILEIRRFNFDFDPSKKRQKWNDAVISTISEALQMPMAIN